MVTMTRGELSTTIEAMVKKSMQKVKKPQEPTNATTRQTAPKYTTRQMAPKPTSTRATPKATKMQAPNKKPATKTSKKSNGGNKRKSE
ncbi:hypothetical protein BC828DRAFT_378330 [Blastocladiella britannica]|nr:hypothetical protein BC828DRAFT_378330 [Blastocladiella britannica]